MKRYSDLKSHASMTIKKTFSASCAIQSLDDPIQIIVNFVVTKRAKNALIKIGHSLINRI